MFGDSSYKDYLKPEQQQDAQTMGWLGAANVLANMSAPRPGGVQPSIFQLLSGGLGGYVGGSQDYVKQLASYYKPLQDMQRNNQMNAYLASDQGKQYVSNLGLPQGMPVSPDMISTLASKRAEKKGDLQLEQYYKPTTEGLIEQAKNPALVQRAGMEEAARNPALIQRAAGTEAATQPYKKDMANFNANLDVWKNMNSPHVIEPQGSLVVPSQAGDANGGVVYKDNRPDAATRKVVADNLSSNQSSNEALKMLDQMESLNKNSYDGYAAGTRANIAANTFGSKKKIQNTASLDTLSKKFTLDLLGGKLGVAISDADRKFIESMSPKIEDTIDQRQAKIDTLRIFMNNKITNTNSVNNQLLSGSAFKGQSGWSAREVK